jgi:hypothetical protein
MWKFDSTFGLFLTIKTTHITTTNNMAEHDAAVLAKQVKDLTKTLEFYKTLINQIDIELGGGGRKGGGRWPLEQTPHKVKELVNLNENLKEELWDRINRWGDSLC